MKPKHSKLGKEIIKGLKEAVVIAKSLKPIPFYSPKCPSCELRRQQQNDAMRRYRERSAK